MKNQPKNLSTLTYLQFKRHLKESGLEFFLEEAESLTGVPCVFVRSMQVKSRYFYTQGKRKGKQVPKGDRPQRRGVKGVEFVLNDTFQTKWDRKDFQLRQRRFISKS